MSTAFTKELELTPLSVETKTFQKKAGGTFEKVEITAELPNAGKVWLKAWPEEAVGVTVGVPFWAVVTATPKTTGTGYFYDFKTVDGAAGIPQKAEPKPEPREMSDDDAIRVLAKFVEAQLAQIKDIAVRNGEKLDALLADRELDTLAGDAVRKGF